MTSPARIIILMVLLGTILSCGSGSNEAEPTVNFATGPTIDIPLSGLRSAAFADFNQDGILDLAALGTTGFRLSPSGASAVIVFGNGQGGFVSDSPGNTGNLRFFPLTASPSPNSLTLGDVNGDGNVDIVSAGGGSLVVLLGDGMGHFATTVVSDGADVQECVVCVAIGDLNQDNAPDLGRSRGRVGHVR